jgi:hypothetical protein
MVLVMGSSLEGLLCVGVCRIVWLLEAAVAGEFGGPGREGAFTGSPRFSISGDKDITEKQSGCLSLSGSLTDLRPIRVVVHGRDTREWVS